MESAGCWLHRSTATRLELDAQPDGAVQNSGRPDQFRPAAGCVIREISTGSDGHRIRDSHTSFGGPKLGMQYRGVGLIVLTSLDDMFGRNDEVTAPRDVQQSTKDGFRIETGKAQPGNTAVQTDERRRRPVTDETHVFEPRILFLAMALAEARLQLQHTTHLDPGARPSTFGWLVCPVRT